MLLFFEILLFFDCCSSCCFVVVLALLVAIVVVVFCFWPVWTKRCLRASSDLVVVGWGSCCFGRARKRHQGWWGMGREVGPIEK